MKTHDLRAKSELARGIYEQGDPVVTVAHAIHADPETAFSEERASARLVDLLADGGFEIRTGVASLPTAFVASRGNGELRVTLCAEYDALGEEIGHGSGRHLVAGAAVGAAIGLVPFVDEARLTVTVTGTPAAALLDLDDPPAGHTSTGKQLLLDAGAFDDADAVLALYPSAGFTGFTRSCARTRMRARLSPKAGASFADAGLDGDGLRSLEDRMLHAALARGTHSTGCTLRRSDDGAITGDLTIAAATLRQVEAAETAAGRALARIAADTHMEPSVITFDAIREVRSDALLRRVFLRNAASLGLAPEPAARGPVFSSDLGPVSAKTAVVAPMLALRGTAALGTREFAALADTEDAYRSMLHGAVALAWTVYDVASDLRARAHFGLVSRDDRRSA